MKVDGKLFVVTGGGNGIGRQTVLELLERGAHVAAVDIRQESLDETAALANAGDRLATFVTDITDRDATARLPGEVEEALGVADGLVNNAGIIQPFVQLKDLDHATMERVMNVNFWGTINMVQAFLPVLLDRPEAHIANVSSMGAFLPVPGQTIYGASKAAVKLMTEGLYAELRDTGVGVSVVMPGPVATDVTANSGVDVPGGTSSEDSNIPQISPEEAADQLVDGIEAARFHIFLGRTAVVMNALSRIAPRQSTHLIQRQMRSLLS